jgi:hypothetical protein
VARAPAFTAAFRSRGSQNKEWKSFHQRVLLAMVQCEARAIQFNSGESTVRYLGIESTTLSPKPTD